MYRSGLALVAILCDLTGSTAFLCFPQNGQVRTSGRDSFVGVFSVEKMNDGADEETKTDSEKPDDSGRSSDMTDRFKYKVNALMGTYDPTHGPDDEHQSGNILNGKRRYQHFINVENVPY